MRPEKKQVELSENEKVILTILKEGKRKMSLKAAQRKLLVKLIKHGTKAKSHEQNWRTKVTQNRERLIVTLTQNNF